MVYDDAVFDQISDCIDNTGAVKDDATEKLRQINEPEDCSVYTIEKDGDLYERAGREIGKLGYGNMIRRLQGDGEECIEEMLRDADLKFDLIFIDAAKSHYKRFLEASLKVLSENGVIICDDTLFQGRPALEAELPPRKHRTNTLALREFNEFVKNDPRFSASLISVGNGLTIIKPVDK